MANGPPPKRLWLLILALVVAGGAMFWQLSQSATSFRLPLFDFVEYWAAGRLCIEGRNPYSHEEIEVLERQAGREEKAVLMWNPPWTLPWVMPFGALPVHTAHLLWLLLNLAILLLCADLLWRFYGGDKEKRWLGWLILFTFFPTLLALTSGQISPWLLLGATGFLVFLRGEHSFLAGAAASLLAIKPHLSWLFWIALLLWAIEQKQWKVIIGGLIAGTVCLAIPLLWRPSVLGDYFYALTHRPPAEYDSPTLGTVVRYFFGRDNFRLQFVALIPGLLWFIPYWIRRHREWQWSDCLPVLLLVSMLTAAYGAWPFDAVLLLVAIFQVGVPLSRVRGHGSRIAILGFYVLINVGAIAVLLANLGYFGFLWLTPALTILYLCSRKALHSKEVPDG